MLARTNTGTTAVGARETKGVIATLAQKRLVFGGSVIRMIRVLGVVGCGELGVLLCVYGVIVETLGDEDEVCYAEINGEGYYCRYKTGPYCS